MMMRLVTLILSVVALATVVYSDKDTNFYYPGFTNPNIKHEMYWKDAAQRPSRFEPVLGSVHHASWMCVSSNMYCSSKTVSRR